VKPFVIDISERISVAGLLRYLCLNVLGCNRGDDEGWQYVGARELASRKAVFEIVSEKEK
jgi:hypothetical protein